MRNRRGDPPGRPQKSARQRRAPARAALFFMGGFLILACLSGCATLESDLLARHPFGLPPAVEMTDVPFYPQKTYQCGPASLAMLLAHGGETVTPDELVPLVYSPKRKGSLQMDLVGAARRYGSVAMPVSGIKSLLAEAAKGNPAVVLLNLGLSWYPVWHYAVVIGYDIDDGEIILRSGVIERDVMSMRLFERMWTRGGAWGLLVLPPGRLPAAADEQAYLDAVIGLERAGKPEAAAIAYEAALTRWPKSLVALMGLGNSRYAQGDLLGAEHALGEAVRIHPDAAPAYNNLAHVLARNGRRDEARSAAERAVELGGPMVETYRETLREIEGMR